MQTQEIKIDTCKAIDDDLVVTESSRTKSEVQDDSSRSGNDTDADDVDIRPIYDEEPMARVQLTVECNIFAIGQHHTEQPEIINEDSRKDFCNYCFKNDLRKLKGNSVDTKFAKTSVLGKPVLQSLRNQLVVRQLNAFKSERPQMSKPRFASQVDVNNNFSRPVTQHYFPKRRESICAKPDHMIASRESRNSFKNMPKFSSNDMVHNHYLCEARKKTKERDRNLKTSVMPYARFQSTVDDSKPKPKSNNQTLRSLPVSKSSYVTITAVPKADHSKSSSSFSDSKYLVCSTCYKCVFNANHDASITKLLNEVNSHAKIQSHKTRNSRIFKIVSLRWIPTEKLFDSCTSKVNSEPPYGSNADIPNIHECKQTLDVSAGTSINVQKEQSIDLSAAVQSSLVNVKEVPTSDMISMMTMIELKSLFGSSFDEYFNRENQVVSKSSAVATTDASDKRQQQPNSTSSTSTLATTVSADGNFDL
nr:hypothetical protein [Tanacetum cinerariifolium]